MSETIEDKLVRIGLKWIDTPWDHNQRSIGIGVDCIRLLDEIGKEAGLTIEPLPEHYNKTPQGNSFQDYLDRNFDLIGKTIEAVQKGKILLFQLRGIYTHVGIATSTETFLHANSDVGRVMVQPLNGKFERVLSGVYEVRR